MTYKFRITNQHGQVVGTYDAKNKAEALDLMAIYAGYVDYADYRRRAPWSERAWWLTVSKDGGQ